MASQWFQAYGNGTAAITTDVYVCRIALPWVHQLVSVAIYAHNIVTTGTVTVALKFTDPNSGRGGTKIATELKNPDLEDFSSLTKKYAYALTADDKATAPAWREYFLVLTGTDAADRFDEPILVLEVKRVSA